MNRQTGIVLLSIVLGLCLLCLFLALGFYASLGGWSGIQKFVSRSQALQAEIDEMGTRPPEVEQVEAAFPAHVGDYTLEGEIERIYESYVDNYAYQAIYIGSKGSVELTLVRHPHTAEAETYVNLRKNWVDINVRATQTTIDLPGKQLVIYDGAGQAGRIWNSGAWVLEIQAKTQAARDDFFAALPYR